MIDAIDQNNDGVDDLLFGVPSQDTALVFYGSVAGMPSVPSVILRPPQPPVVTQLDGGGNLLRYNLTGSLGSSVASGNVRCSGIACGRLWAVGVPGGEIDIDNNGSFDDGHNLGLVWAGQQILDGDRVGSASFGQSLANAGDVNGDGDFDLLVRSGYNYDETVGPELWRKVFLYLGSPDLGSMNLRYAWSVRAQQRVGRSETRWAVQGTLTAMASPISSSATPDTTTSGVAASPNWGTGAGRPFGSEGRLHSRIRVDCRQTLPSSFRPMRPIRPRWCFRRRRYQR